MLLSFMGFIAAFMTPVGQLINLGQVVQEMRTQMERVEDVMRYEVDVPEDDAISRLVALIKQHGDWREP